MTLDDFQRMLSNAGIDLKLMVHQHEKIAQFLSLRSEWNKTHNLSGPAADKDPWNLDVCDAAALNQVYRTGSPLSTWVLERTWINIWYSKTRG